MSLMQLNNEYAGFGILPPLRSLNSFTNYTFDTVAVNSAGLFVAIARNNSNGVPYTTNSINGVDWSTFQLVGGASTAVTSEKMACSSSGRYVAVCINLTGTANLAATSTDGITWTPFTSFLTGSTWSFSALTVNSSGTFMATGTDSTNHAVVTTSTDGVNWTGLVQVNAGVVFSPYAIAASGSGTFTILGTNASASPLFSTTTNGGTTWTTPTIMPGGATGVILPQYIAVNNAGLFVAVLWLYGSTSYAYTATSTDGLTWTTLTSQTLPSLNISSPTIGVNPVNGMFLMMGYDSLKYTATWYMTSYDGVNWTPIQVVPFSYPYFTKSNIVCAKGKFVVVGESSVSGNYAPTAYTSF